MAAVAGIKVSFRTDLQGISLLSQQHLRRKVCFREANK